MASVQDLLKDRKNYVLVYLEKEGEGEDEQVRVYLYKLKKDLSEENFEKLNKCETAKQLYQTVDPWFEKIDEFYHDIYCAEENDWFIDNAENWCGCESEEEENSQESSQENSQSQEGSQSQEKVEYKKQAKNSLLSRKKRFNELHEELMKLGPIKLPGGENSNLYVRLSFGLEEGGGPGVDIDPIESPVSVTSEEGKANYEEFKRIFGEFDLICDKPDEDYLDEAENYQGEEEPPYSENELARK